MRYSPNSSLTPTHREYYGNKNSLISERVKSFVFLWSKMWIEWTLIYLTS